MKTIKDILIITHFTQVPGESGNGRFHYIAEKIDKNNANVEVITTSFSHASKKQRIVSENQMKSISYKLTMLYEPKYVKNVSIRRFFSHYIMGRNLKKYLKIRKKPDVIYCAVPSLDVAKVAAKYAKDNNIRFIIDVQDLWPEAYKMVFDVPVISDMIFLPMNRKADYIYKSADEIVAVSQTYVDRALRVNEKCTKGMSVFLGTELKYFDKLVDQYKVKKSSDEIWIAYIGTLGHSYDINAVIEALSIIKNRGINNAKFVVMGDGPLKNKFEDFGKEKNVYCEFTGRLEYSKMVGLLAVCDIAVNPIRSGSAGSVINKVGDYAAVGLPVINTQECIEYRKIIDEYQMGFNCINGDANDMAEKIYILINSPEIRTEMGSNNRKLAEERFDREVTYKGLLSLIEEC